ncbi:hypothetical protein E2562_037569 [Oryza meyeriana var. granulata]|uniref:O-fucosyltransferase family protein n=1 Tax=Oryza meyeriana var. granulata TaxID=110450 RepID=A0A6G1CLJ3_9ORYZ|nr:hypothetical protein E2562_037569 [Oryza meyeriana var. granulata]
MRSGSHANHKLPLCQVEEGCHQSTRLVASVPDHMQDATAGTSYHFLIETILSALPHCAVLEAPVFCAAAPTASSPRHHKLRNPATDSEICDMVTIARYLNVTLTVLELDKISFWYDPSEFKDIFDVDCIASLRDEVWVLKELPPRLKRRAELGYVHSMPPISRGGL